MPITTRKPAGAGRPKPADDQPDPDDPNTIAQALAELSIDRPILTSRLVGNRLELTLYGGDLVYWPPDPIKAAPRGRPGRK